MPPSAHLRSPGRTALPASEAPLIPLRDNVGRRGFTPVTWVLVLLWAGAWVACLFLDAEVVGRLQRALALDAPQWRHAIRVLGGREPGHRGVGDFGEALFALVVPLVGYKLVHGGATQVISNALVFLLFAGRLEARAGSARFLVFHELAGAIAALTQLIWWDVERASGIGASGAVAGTVAAYVLLYGRRRVLVLVPVIVVPVLVEVPALLVVTAWALFQVRPIARLLEIGPVGPLAWSAYLGGAVGGLVLAPWLLRTRSKRGRR